MKRCLISISDATNDRRYDNEPFAWIREIETGFVVYTTISAPKKFKTLEEALEYIER